MNKIMIWCSGVALAGAVAVGGPAAAAPTAGSHGATAGLHGGTIGSWGKAIEVPGLAALNTGGDASVTTISCPSAGNCTAAGDYSDRHDDLNQGFVVDERHGRWGKAIAVPGLVALNTDEYAEVNEVSCGSAGNCAVGGFYTGPRGGQQGFLAVERHGHWGDAIDVPGLVALNKGKNGEVDDVSCGSAGNCVAGGFYGFSQIGERAFEIVERNGVWGTAIEVPGLAALDKGGYSGVESISCVPAGNCAVGGYYTSHYGDQRAFLASVRHGRLTNAIVVPAPAALNVVGVSPVSCATARYCAAVGVDSGRGGHDHPFAVVERNGRWGKAIEFQGLANQGKGGSADVGALSCGSVGDCAAGGSYQAKGDVHEHAVVVVERNGRWGKAIAVPGLAAQSKSRRSTEVLTLSCDRAGDCAAGGFYYDRPGHYSWFVVVERSGRWGKAAQVPGLAALNIGQDGIDPSGNTFALSCAPGGACAAGGLYVTASRDGQAFVTQPRR